MDSPSGSQEQANFGPEMGIREFIDIVAFLPSSGTMNDSWTLVKTLKYIDPLKVNPMGLISPILASKRFGMETDFPSE
jgi:hypothetical protein